jgi:hypothetical protein
MRCSYCLTTMSAGRPLDGAGRRRVMRQFTWDAIAEGMRKRYETLVRAGDEVA